MSKRAVQLLEAFEALPLTDEEIGEAGRSLFAFLDQEENASTTR